MKWPVRRQASGRANRATRCEQPKELGRDRSRAKVDSSYVQQNPRSINPRGISDAKNAAPVTGRLGMHQGDSGIKHSRMAVQMIDRRVEMKCQK